MEPKTGCLFLILDNRKDRIATPREGKQMWGAHPGLPRWAPASSHVPGRDRRLCLGVPLSRMNSELREVGREEGTARRRVQEMCRGCLRAVTTRKDPPASSRQGTLVYTSLNCGFLRV